MTAQEWEIICIDCVTLVTERQSPRINFSSGSLIIFNHPSEMKAGVIDMTSTKSTWGSPELSSFPPALTDEFNKRGLSENRPANLSPALLAWNQQY